MEPSETSDSFRLVGTPKDPPITRAQAARFRQLAWPMLPVVLRTAQCLTRSADQAEDLTQETMIKAMRAIGSFRDGSDIKAWLLTILRRTHIDRLRSKRNRPVEHELNELHLSGPAAPDAGEYDDAWNEPEELMNRFEDEAIIQAMQVLPEDIRWTILLVDVEQMEQQQAAGVLEVPVGTIKSRVHRGRAMLRDQLYELASRRGWVQSPEKTHEHG